VSPQPRRPCRAALTSVPSAKPQPCRPWRAALTLIQSAKPQTVLIVWQDERAQRVGIQNRTAALASIQSASRAALLLVALPLADCGESGGTPPPVVVSTAPIRVTDAGQLARGAKIYKANCAVCHGGRHRARRTGRSRDQTENIHRRRSTAARTPGTTRTRSSSRPFRKARRAWVAVCRPGKDNSRRRRRKQR
jgi:hypothetical protein